MSQLFKRMEEQGLVAAQGKEVCLADLGRLKALAGSSDSSCDTMAPTWARATGT